MRLPQRVRDSIQEQINTSFHNEINRHEGQVVDITDTGVGANTEFSVPHALAYIPDQVEVLVTEDQTDAYIEVKPSGTAWTKTAIFLKCNTANCAMKLRLS